MVYIFFDKKSKESGVNMPLEFNENIWGADLADMQLISKFNKGFKFLLCVIDICSKMCLGCSFKRKKVFVLLMLFKKY